MATNWSDFYGPPAADAPYCVGQTLIYDDNGVVENGEIIYVPALDENGQPDLHYIVSPAEAAFPCPVYPSQIIAAM